MRRGFLAFFSVLALAVSASAQEAKPKLYLLAVGVSVYQNSALDLEFPAKDATDVAAAWQTQKGQLYRDIEVRRLTDQQATRDAILDGLEWLELSTGPGDVAILFFAGHGVNDSRTGEYLFLPHDADLKKRRTSLIPDRELRSLSSISGKVLLFLDTCHSGNVLEEGRTRGLVDVEPLVQELSEAGRGIVAFAAAGRQQKAQETSEWNNGAFTRALLEALQGAGDRNHDRIIRITEVESYLGERVRELTGGLQTPVSRKPGSVPDLPIAVLPGAEEVPPVPPDPVPGSERGKPDSPARQEVSGFLFELVECKANGHRVTCSFFITNQQDDREIFLSDSTRLFDEAGNESELNRVRIANTEQAKYLRKKLVSGLRTPAVLTFIGFPTGASRISLLDVQVGEDHAKFRNVPLH